MPGVAFSQAMPALAEALPSVEPYEAPMFIRRERHTLFRGGDEEEVLLR